MNAKAYWTPVGKFAQIQEHHLIRMDGRVERVCDHGVGHAVGHIHEWKDWMEVHGCDGCCHELGYGV
jgi:hypothetical protein